VPHSLFIFGKTLVVYEPAGANRRGRARRARHRRDRRPSCDASVEHGFSRRLTDRGKLVIGGERCEPDCNVWNRCSVGLEVLVQSIEVGQPAGVEIDLDRVSELSLAGASLLSAAIGDSGRQRPRFPASRAAKPRNVKDYSDGARKRELRRSAWWWMQFGTTRLRPKFPASREFSREFLENGPKNDFFASNRQTSSMSCYEIPCSTEQGIWLSKQGIWSGKPGISDRC
jgi:hypothetical protein